MTRSECLRTDKFALMSETWNTFIHNTQAYYKSDENISVDEQLFLTKVRCCFTQYMPNKLQIYGIKFSLVVSMSTQNILQTIFRI